MRAMSPLRYPGGKSRALRHLIPHFPCQFEAYREPCVGGGSVYLAVASQGFLSPTQAWLNDANPQVMAFWRCVKERPDELCGRLRWIRRNYPDGQALFRALEADSSPDIMDMAIRFFVLNRLSFSGCVDRSGFAPASMELHWTESAIVRVEDAVELVRKARLTCGDYRDVVLAGGDDVFIFLDPPYCGNTASRLYGKKGEFHVGFNHERLAEALMQTPHRWLLTYDDVPEIRSLYAFADIVPWQLQYSFNTQNPLPSGSELIIKNF